jgi:hypothetical protein
MLVGSALFFFLASFGQLVYLHSRINDSPPFDASALKSMPDPNCPTLDTGVLDLQRLRLEGALEANVVARRYHQANVLLMSRVWSHYLGFVTGMILSLVGAAFVLGRLKDSGTQLSGKQEWLEFTLATASPGITLCVLGVLLMISTIVVHHDIQTADVAIYLGKDVGKPKVDLTPAPTQQR